MGRNGRGQWSHLIGQWWRWERVVRLADLAPLRLLHLGPLVLEPDLDLVPRQPQLPGQPLPPRLGEVAAGAELPLEPLQLLAVEGRARPLAAAVAVVAPFRRRVAVVGFRYISRSPPTPPTTWRWMEGD